MTMIVLFSIGLPGIYQALLYPHRALLREVVGGSSAAGAPASCIAGGASVDGASPVSHKDKGTAATLRGLSFLYADYKQQFWWWESCEIARKLLLTGALVRFQKGSLMQLVVAMVIIVLHMLFWHISTLTGGPHMVQWHSSCIV